MKIVNRVFDNSSCTLIMAGVPQHMSNSNLIYKLGDLYELYKFKDKEEKRLVHIIFSSEEVGHQKTYAGT